jgi:enoyl-[acyl-carrier-protein] reductase (NADH)
MIDSKVEKLITLQEAAEIAPGYRPSQHASIEAVRRWARTGMRGIRLETIVAGGRRCTSAEAVQRFFERLTHARDHDPLENRRRRCSRTDSDKIKRELLEEHGIRLT